MLKPTPLLLHNLQWLFLDRMGNLQLAMEILPHSAGSVR